MYEKFDDFFDYYIAEIKNLLPDYEKYLAMVDKDGNNIGFKHIHQLLKPLTSKQTNELNVQLRIIMKIPQRIKLVYDRNATTFYSTFDSNSKRFVIGYPTVTYYFQKYPVIIKAAMKHEMGHILNKDAFAGRERIHSDCTNRCMDARINIHIPHEELDFLTRCLFSFENTPGIRYINADDFYTKIHLPLVPGGYSWETAHEQYHLFDQNPPEEDEGGGGGQGDPTQGDGTEQDQEDIEDILGGLPDELPEGEDEGEGGGEEEEEGTDGGGGEKEGEKDKDGNGEKEGEGEGAEKGGDSPADKARKRRQLRKFDEQIQKSIKALEKLKEKF